MPLPAVDPIALLRALSAHGVAFVVVGGVGAVLHGAPVTTHDLDVVYALEPDNVDRLMSMLADVDAVFRARPDLRPARSHIESSGHKLLLTIHGALDLLGHAGDGHGYAELLATSVRLDVDGLEIEVVDLPMLIRLKEEVGGAKDLATLPTLRATLRERDEGSVGAG